MTVLLANTAKWGQWKFCLRTTFHLYASHATRDAFTQESKVCQYELACVKFAKTVCQHVNWPALFSKMFVNCFRDRFAHANFHLPTRFNILVRVDSANFGKFSSSKGQNTPVFLKNSNCLFSIFLMPYIFKYSFLEKCAILCSYPESIL